jgi:hypothetical protein
MLHHRGVTQPPSLLSPLVQEPVRLVRCTFVNDSVILPIVLPTDTSTSAYD